MDCKELGRVVLASVVVPVVVSVFSQIAHAWAQDLVKDTSFRVVID